MCFGVPAAMKQLRDEEKEEHVTRKDLAVQAYGRTRLKIECDQRRQKKKKPSLLSDECMQSKLGRGLSRLGGLMKSGVALLL